MASVPNRDFIVLDLTLVDLVGRDAAQLWERVRWRAQDRGGWIATYDDMAAETRLTRSMLSRAIKTLREAGLLTSRNAFDVGRTQVWWAHSLEDPTVTDKGSNGYDVTVPPIENQKNTNYPAAVASEPPPEEHHMDQPTEPEFSLISEDDMPPTQPARTGQTLVKRWVEGHRSTGEADPPGPLMKRIVGQCGRLAKDCVTDEDWRAAYIACYRAGELGRVDPVPLMVKARSQFEQRRFNENGFLADARAAMNKPALQASPMERFRALTAGDES